MTTLARPGLQRDQTEIWRSCVNQAPPKAPPHKTGYASSIEADLAREQAKASPPGN